MAPKKNILLMIADDLGRDQMGCYGGHQGVTPHLDAFADSGIRFNMAFTSTASCSGSRTVIYTGLHTHENGSYGLNYGRNGFHTFDGIETAPQLFNKFGYHTGILGKVHVDPKHLYPWNVREESETRNVAFIADRAEDFFAASKKVDQPFFLTIGFIDPHRVLQSRGGFGNVEGNYDPRLRDRIFTPEEVSIPPFLSDLPEVRQELAEYYRSIHRMDQGVNLILEALHRQGLAEDTLVLFLSDNGPPFINSKTTLFDAGVRLPFLLRVPGRGNGVVNPNLVSYVDILPTLCDWAGYRDLGAGESQLAKRRGRSILPITETQSVQETWDHVFGSHTFHEITNYWPTRYMRTIKYKYHRNVCWKLDFPFAMDLYASLSFEAMRNSATGSTPAMVGPRKLKNYICRPAEELFDIEEDPAEIVNLASDPKYADLLKEMRGQLELWQEQTNDLWLWRDGTAVARYRASGYIREGLKIPDRFDIDAENPGIRDIAAVDMSSMLKGAHLD